MIFSFNEVLNWLETALTWYIVSTCFFASQETFEVIVCVLEEILKRDIKQRPEKTYIILVD